MPRPDTTLTNPAHLALLIAALALAFAAGTARADFNDGVVAHAMGDYERALQTLLPLAETSDHAYAQYFLGVMYANGQGVDQDHEQAVRWYRAAAEKGVAAAQTRLGQLYLEGQGVPRDMEFAYAWFSVAAQLGNARAARLLEQTRGRLSATEAEQAERLAREYITSYGKPPPGPPAPQ